jgi:hypothetical protein
VGDDVAASTKVRASSSAWDSTYTTTNSNSAAWQNTYTTVQSNSATWGEVGDDVAASTKVRASSSAWDSTYTITNSNSAAWGSTYTTVQSNSATWGGLGNPFLRGNLSKLAGKTAVDANYVPKILILGDSLVELKNSKLNALQGTYPAIANGAVYALSATQGVYGRQPIGQVYLLSVPISSFSFCGSGTNPITATIAKLHYIAENNAGTFKVEVGPTTSGPWTVLTASINANNLGSAVAVVVSYPLSATGPSVLRATRLSGDTTLLGAEFYEPRARFSSFWMAKGSTDIDSWYLTPEALIAPIITEYDPDVIYLEMADEAPLVEQYVTDYIDRLTATMTTLPGVILIPRNPYWWDTGDTTQIAQSNALFTIALARGYGFLDWRNYFGSGVLARDNGLVQDTENGVHPIDAGFALQVQILQDAWPEVFPKPLLSLGRKTGGTFKLDLTEMGLSELPILNSGAANYSVRLGYLSGTLSTGFGLGIQVRSLTDAMAPGGWDIENRTSAGAYSRLWLIGADGTLKIGGINISSTTTAGTDGAQIVSIPPSTSRVPFRAVSQSGGVSDIFSGFKGTDEKFAINYQGQAHVDGGFVHGATGDGPAWFVGGADPSSVVTISIGTPGIITLNAHGLKNGTPIRFSTDGGLPTGLFLTTTYQVKNATPNTFEVALNYVSSSVNTSGTQTGIHTMSIWSPDGSLYSKTAGGQLFVRESGAWVSK